MDLSSFGFVTVAAIRGLTNMSNETGQNRRLVAGNI